MPVHETAIPNYAFAGCSNLVGVVGMAGVISIPARTFQNSGLVGNFAWPAG